MIFLPKQLNVKAVVSPEIRRRGIFDVLVYQAGIQLNCQFLSLKNIEMLANITVHWPQAKIATWVDDVRGINKVELKVNDHLIPAYSGSAELKHKFSGVHTPLQLMQISH